MGEVSDNSVFEFTQEVINTLNTSDASCEGCKLLKIADRSNWLGATLIIPSGEQYTYLGYNGGEKGVQQEALCRFHRKSVDTLCTSCADLHGQLRNFPVINGQEN